MGQFLLVWGGTDSGLVIRLILQIYIPGIHKDLPKKILRDVLDTLKTCQLATRPGSIAVICTKREREDTLVIKKYG